jgi:hypothetical protein
MLHHLWLGKYMAATERSPFSAYCCNHLQPPLSYVVKPKALVTNQGHHVNITTHMHVTNQG